MIRVYRDAANSDVILTVGDGFEIVSAYLSEDDLADLFDAINHARASSKTMLVDIETDGYVESLKEPGFEGGAS